jgi:hypothetical protein
MDYCRVRGSIFIGEHTGGCKIYDKCDMILIFKYKYSLVNVTRVSCYILHFYYTSYKPLTSFLILSKNGKNFGWSWQTLFGKFLHIFMRKT